MRKLVYELENGKVVTTYKEAAGSGLSYATRLETISAEPSKMTEKRAARRIKIK